MDQECCVEEPNDRVRWKGWGTFLFWQGERERGEHNERGKKGLQPGFQRANGVIAWLKCAGLVTLVLKRVKVLTVTLSG